LKEEHRLRVFENRVLRKIFGRKRGEVTGEWRRLHNEEINVLVFSPNIIRVIRSRMMRWAEHVVSMVEWSGTFKIMVWKTDGNRLLGRARRRWEDNIKMDQEIG
jgi:hypothetical protein